jgi:hypothetical protein
MPFKYVLRWTNGEREQIGVEAWVRYPTMPKERKHPAFVIGMVEGSRTIVLRDRVEHAAALYGARTFGKSKRVTFPLDDTKAVAEAYRIGLTAAVLRSAEGNEAVNRASRYVLSVPDEEVWFWTSKLLDPTVSREQVIDALCVLSGARPVAVAKKNLQTTLL